MNLILQIITCMFVGYLIGGINPSYILAKMKGFDIRSKGSGNAGASNAMITIGKKAGVVCAVFDIFKGYLAVKIGIRMYPVLKIAGMITGVCCVLGHIYPVFMNFRGGKGLASLAGIVLAYDIRVFVMLFMFELVLVLVVDYICIVPISGSFLFMLILAFQCGGMYSLCFLPIVVVVLYKHKENIKRIQYGVEARVSYLWKKDEEIARLQSNWDMLTDEQRDSFESEAYI